jgi:catechol 2,3-dioxygenase
VLPASTSIGRVTLQVADLERSRSFYRDLIGFREIERSTSGANTSRLGVDASNNVWLELIEKRGVRKVPPRGLMGLYHFAVLLPSREDLGRFLVHALNAGGRVASADHLVSEALYLVDPDGLTIEVYRDRPRSEWKRNGGELMLATLPLDTDGVAGAADGAWRGLPAGTVIGHIHLYIGDLDGAEDFYHHGLGFDPVLRSFPGALFVSAGGYHHHVGLNTWAAHTRVATDDDARMLSWEMVVPKAAMAAVGDRLRAGGYTVTDTEAGIASVDPWDNRVRVIAR